MFFQVVITYLQAALLSGVTTFAGFGPGIDGEVTEGERIEAWSDYGLCSASSDRSRTGRQWAIVRVSPRETSICLREKRGGEAPNDVPDCWKVAREEFGCEKVVDIN